MCYIFWKVGKRLSGELSGARVGDNLRLKIWKNFGAEKGGSTFLFAIPMTKWLYKPMAAFFKCHTTPSTPLKHSSPLNKNLVPTLHWKKCVTQWLYLHPMGTIEKHSTIHCKIYVCNTGIRLACWKNNGKSSFDTLQVNIYFAKKIMRHVGFAALKIDKALQNKFSGPWPSAPPK